MSTEKSVRVRVKVYDNATSIYSQDIEISNGEGTFVVPAILADSDVIALQVNNIFRILLHILLTSYERDAIKGRVSMETCTNGDVNPV